MSSTLFGFDMLTVICECIMKTAFTIIPEEPIYNSKQRVLTVYSNATKNILRLASYDFSLNKHSCYGTLSREARM